MVLLNKKPVRFLRSFIELYTDKRLSRASAALSYFLTMTFFPLIICLYTLLGNSYEKAVRILSFAEHLMAAETVSYLREFLTYVSANNSTAMMVAGLTVLVTSSSAAVRSLQATIGEMQGKQRYQGVMGFVFSIVFSLLFLAAIYFAMLVMLTGRSFLLKLNSFLPFIDISNSWNSMRFIVLAAIDYVIIWGVYEVSISSDGDYCTWPGAILAMLAMVGVSAAFSVFISASAKYPLVYGSLAAVILLMFWIYACCLVIYCGAAFNIVLRDFKTGTSG